MLLGRVKTDWLQSCSQASPNQPWVPGRRQLLMSTPCLKHHPQLASLGSRGHRILAPLLPGRRFPGSQRKPGRASQVHSTACRKQSEPMHAGQGLQAVPRWPWDQVCRSLVASICQSTEPPCPQLSHLQHCPHPSSRRSRSLRHQEGWSPGGTSKSLSHTPTVLHQLDMQTDQAL